MTAEPNTTVASTTDPLEVRLDSGVIRGADIGDTRMFSGIRYAAPPVGPLRWTLPQPVQPWEGVAEATEPGNASPQEDFPGATGEDCLFVNVTTPKEHTGEPLPVMVWLHGGGLVMGAGSLYDARRLAAQGEVIVVTVNYRLGIFGFFGHPGLEGSGNFGFADQIAALQWTQRNAAAFGGDPGNVTVFGESAGGMSISALLTSPASVGLFHKAIISSGSGLLNWPKGTFFPGAPEVNLYPSREDNERAGAELAEELGYSGPDAVDRLREKSVDELLAHNQKVSHGIAYGTPLLPTNPAVATAAGQFHRMPVISGMTRDENRSFIGSAVLIEPITEQRYTELLRESFGEKAQEVAGQYPLSEYESPALAWAAVTTDAAWAHSTLMGHQLLARHTSVYAYEFADRTAPNVNQLEVPGLPMGAAHGSDLPSWFDLGGQNLLRPEQQELAHTMVDYWTSFAHTGDPNGPNTPRWLPFDEQGPVLRFDLDVVEPGPFIAEHRCEFWRDLL